MHNSLKFFRDNNKAALFAQMESFLNAGHVSGKSISIEHNGNEVTALVGYLSGNEDNTSYRIVSVSVCKASDNDTIIQEAINKAADDMGNFICQSCCIENGDLSVVFLTA